MGSDGEDLVVVGEDSNVCLMQSGLTVVWVCRMLTGSVLATFGGISRIFSAMNP